MKRPRKPRVGDRVEIEWLDSGMSTHGRPNGKKPDTLHVSTCLGVVVWIGKDKQLPKSMDRTTVWVAHDSAGSKDSRSQLGGIWWPCVVSCLVLVPR